MKISLGRRGLKTYSHFRGRGAMLASSYGAPAMYTILKTLLYSWGGCSPPGFASKAFSY